MGSAQYQSHGGDVDSYSKPAFPQAHHNSSQSSYGRNDDSADASYNSGVGSVGRDNYGSGLSFPQAQHGGSKSAYQSTGGHSTQYDSYSGGVDSSYKPHSSSNRHEGKSQQDLSYDRRDSDTHANRHHRNVSKESKSSNDSSDESRKNKHKKSADHHRGHPSAYQGGQDSYDVSFDLHFSSGLHQR